MKGFLGTDAPFMMDFVLVALILLVPMLIVSIIMAKKGKFDYHKKMQIILAVVILVAVILFEVEMRLAGGIYELTTNSIYHRTAAFNFVLYVHLFFAVTTPFLWAYTIYAALKNFKSGYADNPYLHKHKKLGWLSALDLSLTSVTGIIVYVMGFILTKT